MKNFGPDGRISRRIVNRIRKYFRVLIWGLGVIDDEKNEGQKSHDNDHLSYIFGISLKFQIF
jgi:hypothetical protein